MKTLRFCQIFILSILVISCTKDSVLNPPEKDASLKSAMPHMKIAVMSDLHFLDPSLMINCTNVETEFNTEMMTSNKLVALSDPILKKAVSEILAEKPDLLLIPGDLTKDGEKISHNTVAGILNQISQKGIKIFVVPGNHDINNMTAKKYEGTESSNTDYIQATDFAQIYTDFGYNNAFTRDANSLSYIAEPFNNVWILGLDACKYYENTAEGPKTSGQIKTETLEWMKPWLEKARKNNIMVFGLMHHGVMEVCPGQESFYKGYVVDKLANALVDFGVRVIFTGHFHSSDITSQSNGENTLFDIKTGSLLTTPCPFRIIDVNPNYMNIETRFITSIDATMPNQKDFITYSKEYLFGNMSTLLYQLIRYVYKQPKDIALAYAPHFSKGLCAMYASEAITPEEKQFLESIKSQTELYKILNALYTDYAPEDLELTVDMRKKFR